LITEPVAAPKELVRCNAGRFAANAGGPAGLAVRSLQKIFTKPLTRIGDEFIYGVSRALYGCAAVGRQSPD
jgi:hypothetical protein